MLGDWAALHSHISTSISASEDSYISETTALTIFFVTVFALGAIAILLPLIEAKNFQIKDPDETLLSARASYPWWVIAASFFSSSLGSWVISGPAEIGQYAGWLGIIGYAFACGAPWWVLAYFGPKLRNITQGRGFTATDFVRVRYGLALHIVYVVVGLTCAVCGLIVEATTIGEIFATVSPAVNPLIITITIACVTFLYTMLGGLRASLLTDRVQFFAIVVLTLVGGIAICSQVGPQVGKEEFNKVANWTVDGLITGLVLNVSCFFPTFADPSAWARMYSARSSKDASVGLLIAGGCVMVPMLFFGVCGALAQAAYNAGLLIVDDGEEYWDPMFALLTLVPSWISCLMLVFATCLSTSTVDTYISGIACCFAGALEKRHLNYNWARVIATIFFVPAIVLAAYNPPSIMTVLMIGNLITTATTPPLLLSMWPITTKTSAWVGILGGAFTICCFGWGSGKTFKSGFTYWLLPDGYDLLCLVCFITAGAVSAISAVAVAFVQFKIWPEVKIEQLQVFQKLMKATCAELHDPESSVLTSPTAHEEYICETLQSSTESSVNQYSST